MKWLSILAVAVLVGCGGADKTVQPVDPATWCDTVAAGPGGSGDIAADLAVANAKVRLFGADLDGGSADTALVASLAAPDALDGGVQQTLQTYDGQLLQVCLLPADNRGMPDASVAVQGDVAVIHPGAGDLTLPAGAKAVAIDLRDLPQVPGIGARIEAAAGLALKGDVPRAGREVREFDGLAGETNFASTSYGASLSVGPRDPIKGPAATALPLAFLTGKRIAPEAAELAQTLRGAKLAWIFGEDVRTAAAESCWAGVGASNGFAYRCAEVGSGSRRWPDVYPADQSTANLDKALSSLATSGKPGDLPTTIPNDRPYLQPYNALNHLESSTVDLPTARAALLVAAGEARLFYPYFATTGDTLDAHLDAAIQALDAAPAIDRPTVLAQLQTLAASLDDGQAGALDLVNPVTTALPLVFDQVGGLPVVKASGVSGINRGDALVAVDGTPIDTWLAQQAPYVSASTSSWALARAMKRLVDSPTDVSLTVQAPGGAQTTAVASPGPISALDTLRAGEQAPSGYVASSQIYYLNVDGSQVPDAATLQARVSEAQSATGMVIDLRGTLALNPYQIASSLVADVFPSAVFHIPVEIGGEAATPLEITFNNQPTTGAYGTGKVALVVNPDTVAYAEILAMALTDAGRTVAVVGRGTAGAVGDVTAAMLPGEFAFEFSGMEVLRSDKSTFEGVGLVPTVEVAPTQADLASGNDVALQEAISQVQ